MESYKRMLEFVKSGKKISDPQARQLGNLGIAASRANSLTFSGATIDEAASRKKLKNLSDSEFKTTIAVINKALKENNYNNSILLLNEDYDFYVQRHSVKTIQSHINDALTSLRNALPQIEETWGIPQDAMFDTIKLGAEDRLRKGDYGRKELEDLRSDLVDANFFVTAGKDPELVAQLRSHDIKVSSVLGEYAGGTLSTRIKYMEEFLENREPNPQLGLTDNMNSILGTCMNNLKLAKKFYPAPEELSTFRDQLNEYKSDFAKALKPRMSKQSGGVFSNELANWKLSLPPTYTEYRADLLRKLQDSDAATTGGMNIARRLKTTNPQLVAAVDIFNNFKFQSDPEYANELKELCEENTPTPLRDKASLGADRLTIGALTVRDKHYGAGTCKHELGHLTSGLFMTGKMSAATKNWYEEVRTCLKEPKGHDRNVEEDWADLMGAMSGGKYDDCAYTEDAESELTLKDNPNDSHSSHLYRSFNKLLVTTGAIPNICKNALAEKGEVFNLRDCSKVQTPPH